MSTLTLARGEKPPVDPDDIEYVAKTSFVLALEAAAKAAEEEAKKEEETE
tara:strand:+ start:333 stop:482 length:150 start_codon:yes stop_codon:yes gene_type:complete